MSKKTEAVGYALLAGGGTSAPIDAVRSMANDAEGDVAVAFAWAFAKLGVKSVLLLSRLAFYKHRDNLPKDAVTYVFKTFSQYLALLDTVVATHGTPAWAMSMVAVNDFGYLDHEAPKEKLSSAAERLELNIPALPKVLDTWRARFGKECVIVGFKYLTKANASLHDLIEASMRQNARAHLHGTIGNFKEEIGGGMHPVWWITPDGGAVRVDGWRDDVADQIAKILVRYARTTWHRSMRVEPDPSLDLLRARVTAVVALEFAHKAGLFTGPEGNVAVDIAPGAMLLSPRGVDKRSVGVNDLLVATLDRPTREVRYFGPEGPKPSIDGSVHLSTMGSLRHHAAVHFHHGWVLGRPARTRLAYPCGTLEQARNIEEAVALWQQATGADWNAVRRRMLELRDHGHILYANDFAELARQRDHAVEMYAAHLADIGRADLIAKVTLQPIWREADIVGVTALMNGWRSFFLLPEARGGRLGEQLVELINRRGTRVAAHDRCEVVDFYVNRGFKTVRRIEGEGLVILDPPSVRDDLSDAATVLLHCTTTDRVLLAERSTGVSYGGYHCHLGGKIDRSDTVAADSLGTVVRALIREAGEEGGIDLTGLPEPRPEDVTVHYAGRRTPDGREVGARVINVHVRTVLELPFVPDGSEIVGGGWHSREMAAVRKMGPATKAVLRKAWPDF